MLFNSYIFIGVFLPITLLIFLCLKRIRSPLLTVWLLLSSLFFYGYWNPVYLLLILSSIIVNYYASIYLSRSKSGVWLSLFVMVNLLSIGYFKYSEFLWVNILDGDSLPEFISGVTLPLAISFFTFQQVAYLVDVKNERVKPGCFYNYALYISFFPQLIAGPIVRYQELSPQLGQMDTFRLPEGMIISGFTLFIIGLAKKVIFADTLSPFANDIFSFASNRGSIGFQDAWLGAYTYTFQLYFDFSGYSDMAIGIALLFGVKLPVNFNSPYKSNNIIDFWRRWHITLSRFFRDYVYIPLGGNRRGYFRQVINTSFVMLLTGVWHGAGWTFIIWGAYHGLLILITHLAKLSISHRLKKLILKHNKLFGFLSVVVTFHLVVLGWVLFRAESIDVAMMMIESMLLITNASSTALIDTNLYKVLWSMILISGAICLLVPNSSNITRMLSELRLMQESRLLDTITWMILGAVCYLSISTISRVNSDFLYFNF
nr:hypothetical protein BCU54_08190 [Vibrio lentus]